MEPLSFKANIGLKDIVGRELINDDNIAIVELIKNSKDARSAKVEITFSNASRLANNSQPRSGSQIIVQDFGSGMSLDDIKNKWLNIAYSEKREGHGKHSPAYAGSKGIGRFSCDRLGATLDIYTRTKNGDLIWLPIDWREFEVTDREKEIGSVDLFPRVITESEFTRNTDLKRFSSGTALIIGQLRSVWGEDKLGGLKKELERFVVDPSNNFSVFLYSKDFDSKDLNGKIENKIFDKLDFRTTSIHSQIAEDGENIRTTLKHDGNEVFTLTEVNTYQHLRDIKASIYYLNQPAKAFFKKETGYRLVEFGSVFLFLNGFRVFPYGSESNDWLGLDRRKQQGFARNLGTREVVGVIEISDKENVFHPASSREGLVNNQAYLELTSNTDNVKIVEGGSQYGYIHKIVRKLERFVVEGLDWDKITEDVEEENDEYFLKHPNIQFVDRNRHILASLDAIISARSLEKNIIKVDLNRKYLVALAKKETEATKEFVEYLEKRFEGVSVGKITPAEKRDLSKLIARQKQEIAAKEATNQRLQVETKRALKTAEQLTSENLFLRANSNDDIDAVINLHHQTILCADTISKAIQNFRRKLDQPIDLKKLRDFLDKIEAQNEKVLKISRFATHANFRISSTRTNAEIFTFIKRYLADVKNFGIFNDLQIVDKIPNDIQLIKKIRPLEMTMLIDNLISNAQKANASKIQFSAEREGRSTYLINATDDGNGLSDEIREPDTIFEKGITTTSGSGLGLYHLKKIVADDLGGAAFVANRSKGRFTIGMRFK